MCGLCLITSAMYAGDDARTLDQLRKEVAKNQSVAQAQSDGANSQLEPGPIQPVASRTVSCPDPAAFDLFKHQIAYQRTEELNPLKGLQEIHADVWERGHLHAFYVRDQLKEFVSTVRMLYSITNSGIRGAYTCPVEQNWRDCAEKNAGMEALNYIPQTCTVTVDMHTIPVWKPSPNDPTKQRIAHELRSEIEAKWPRVQEIVIRDFNLKDNQITMSLKMPDGDYYQGCGFHAIGEPHCQGWHLFGQTPASSIRKWIFERPYRLK